MDAQRNKVYINPKFNKEYSLATITKSQNRTMHVNPAFSQLMSNSHSAHSHNTKIFINPKFIEPLQQQTTTVLVEPSTSCGDTLSWCAPRTGSDTSPGADPQQQLVPTAQPVKLSRYRLVRSRKEDTLKKEITVKPKTTIKISKYKSIAIKDVHRNLSVVPSSNLKLDDSNVNHYKKSNRYKLITKVFNKDNKIGANGKLTRSNKSLVTKSTYKVRIDKKTFKKNNIPCPQFRKYGKCLRKDQGRCEFIHDKKHVSICRKFLKGLCVEEQCPRSHDLTTNKMPTCYFYLQGACSKHSCPYVHVKLNENTTVCSDFLKGYCENGSECSKLHINKTNTRTIPKKQLSQQSKEKQNLNVSKTNTLKKPVQSINKRTVSVPATDKDTRYYKDDVSDGGEVCQIKPTRCKIGTLPSFILL